MKRKEIQKIIDNQSRDYWQHLILQWVHDEECRELLTRVLLDNITIESIADKKDVDYKTLYSKFQKGIAQILKHTKI